MGRGGTVRRKQNFKKRSRFSANSSDSDEDYVVSDEENEVSDNDSENYCCSLDEDASEENFSSYVEEEEEEEEKVRKVDRSAVKRGSPRKMKKRNGSKSLQKRRRVSFSEDEDTDEDYNGDGYSDDDDDDEEFSLDEDESLDDEEELTAKRKKNSTACRKKRRKINGSVNKHKRRKKSRVSKKATRKNGTSNRALREKLSYDDDDSGRCMVKKLAMREKTSCRKRRYVAPSDSDFEYSEPSDYEFTISEEEREQVREANELCRRLTTGPRKLSSSKMLSEDEKICMQTKPTLRNGKGKVPAVRKEVVKQMCGICLSEEDKRRVRGTLDCCSHYFCFPCINEWSKVESRCPLCKQRFKTISKPARLNAGIDLRNVVIQVPERDQVYQPSEEELRGYLDPYENVICTECHQGGDDNLMLLCDICDSPWHTYCVGLGWEVPEGNWYCDGCRPVALGSPSSQIQEVSSNLVTENLFNGPFPREELDLNALPSPHTPSLQGLGNSASPRFPPGDIQAASPVTGTGAATLSRRRWIHSQVQNIRSSNRMDSFAGRTDANNAASPVRDFLNSQTNVGGESSVLHPEIQVIRTFDHACDENKLPENSSVPFQDAGFFPLGDHHRSIQGFQDRNTIYTEWPFCGEPGTVNSSGFGQQFQDNGKSSMRYDDSPPHLVEEGNHFHEIQEQLQSVVKNH